MAWAIQVAEKATWLEQKNGDAYLSVNTDLAKGGEWGRRGENASELTSQKRGKKWGTESEKRKCLHFILVERSIDPVEEYRDIILTHLNDAVIFEISKQTS